MCSSQYFLGFTEVDFVKLALKEGFHLLYHASHLLQVEEALIIRILNINRILTLLRDVTGNRKLSKSPAICVDIDNYGGNELVCDFGASGLELDVEEVDGVPGSFLKTGFLLDLLLD